MSGTRTTPTPLQPHATSNSTTVSKGNNKGSLVIVGIIVGSVLVLLCIVVTSYCVIRRVRSSSNKSKTKKKNKEKQNEVTDNLIEVKLELESRNKYVRSPSANKNVQENTDGYVQLAENEEKPLSNPYSVAHDNSTQKVAMVPKPKPPKPKPKPRQKSIDAENDSSVEPGSKRKPMPAPRPITETKTRISVEETKEAENIMYGVPDTLHAANLIYSEPEGIERNNQIYQNAPFPDIVDQKLDIKKALPSTSARIFNKTPSVSDSHGYGDEQKFAMYLPIGIKETIYKIPSNQQRFDPPTQPPGNVMHDIYTEMCSHNSGEEEGTPDYEDVTEFTAPDDEYEDIGVITGDSNTYQSLGEGDGNESQSDDEIIV